MAKRQKPLHRADELKGWQQVAAFLGQTVSVAQCWADSGMPVEKRGRYVYSSQKELNRWLGRESAGEPVQIATDELTSVENSSKDFRLIGNVVGSPSNTF
jgi:hypothetical protein